MAVKKKSKKRGTSKSCEKVVKHKRSGTKIKSYARKKKKK